MPVISGGLYDMIFQRPGWGGVACYGYLGLGGRRKGRRFLAL